MSDNEIQETINPEYQGLNDEKIEKLIGELEITEDSLEQLYEDKKIDETTYVKIKEYLQRKKKKKLILLIISASVIVLAILGYFLLRSNTIDFRINTLSGGNPVSANITFTYNGATVNGITDSNGQFIIKTPGTGTYKITGDYNGIIKEINGNLNEKSADVEFGGEGYAPEEGSVQNELQVISSADSTPIPGASITFKINSGRVLSNVTDANGIISIYAKPSQTVEIIKIEAQGYTPHADFTFQAKDLENGQPHLEQVSLEATTTEATVNPSTTPTVQPKKINIKVKTLDASTNNSISNAQITIKSEFGITLGGVTTGNTGEGIIRDIDTPQTILVSGIKTGLTSRDIEIPIDENFQDTIIVYFDNYSIYGIITPKTTFVTVKTITGLLTQEVDWTLYFKKGGCAGNWNYNSMNNIASGNTTSGKILLDDYINDNSGTGNTCYKVKVSSDNPIEYFDEISPSITYGENTSVTLTQINDSTGANLNLGISRFYGADSNNTIINITDAGKNEYFGGFITQGSPNSTITITKLRQNRIYNIIATKGVEIASIQTQFTQTENTLNLTLDGGNAILNFRVRQVDEKDWSTILDPNFLGTKLTVKQGNTIIFNNVQCDNGQDAICDTAKATNTIKRGIDVSIIATKPDYAQTNALGSNKLIGSSILSATNTPDINVSMYKFTGCTMGDGSNGIVQNDLYNTTCGRINGFQFADLNGNLVTQLGFGQYLTQINYQYNNTDVVGFRIEVDNKTSYNDQTILLAGLDYNDYSDDPQYASGLYDLKIQQTKTTNSITGEKDIPITQINVSNMLTIPIGGENYDFYNLNNSRAIEVEYRHDPTNIGLEDPTTRMINRHLTLLINVDDPIYDTVIPVYVTMWLKKANSNNKDIIVKRIPLNLTKTTYLDHKPSSTTYINNLSVNEFDTGKFNPGECSDGLLCTSITQTLNSNGEIFPNDEIKNGVCYLNNNNYCNIGVYSKPKDLKDNGVYLEQDLYLQSTLTKGLILCDQGNGKTFVDYVGHPLNNYGPCTNENGRSMGTEVCRLQIDLNLNNQIKIPIDTTNYNKVWVMADGFSTYVNLTVRMKQKPGTLLASITSGDAVMLPKDGINEVITTTKILPQITISKSQAGLYKSNLTINCTSGTKTVAVNLTFDSKSDDARCPAGQTWNGQTGKCDDAHLAPPTINECQNAVVYDKTSTSFIGLRNNRSEIILDYNASAGGYQGTCFGILTKDADGNYAPLTNADRNIVNEIQDKSDKNSEQSSKCSYFNDASNPTTPVLFSSGIISWKNSIAGIGSQYDQPNGCNLYGTSTLFNTWNKALMQSRGSHNSISLISQKWENSDRRGRFSQNKSWTERSGITGHEKDYFTLYDYNLAFIQPNNLNLNVEVMNYFSKERNSITEAFDKSYVIDNSNIAYEKIIDKPVINTPVVYDFAGRSEQPLNKLATFDLAAPIIAAPTYDFTINVTDIYNDTDNIQQIVKQTPGQAKVTIETTGGNVDVSQTLDGTNGIYTGSIPTLTGNNILANVMINGIKVDSITLPSDTATSIQRLYYEQFYSKKFNFKIHVTRNIVDNNGQIIDKIDEPSGSTVLKIAYAISNNYKWVRLNSQGIGSVTNSWVDFAKIPATYTINFKTMFGTKTLLSPSSATYTPASTYELSFNSNTYPINVPDFLGDNQNIISDYPYYQSPLYSVDDINLRGQRTYVKDDSGVIGIKSNQPRIELNFSYLPSKHKTLFIQCANTPDLIQSTIYGLGNNIQNTYKVCSKDSGQSFTSILYCGYDVNTQKVSLKALTVGTTSSDLVVKDESKNTLPFYYTDKTDSANPIKIEWSGKISVTKGFITNINSIGLKINQPISSLTKLTLESFLTTINSWGIGDGNIEKYDKQSILNFLNSAKTGLKINSGSITLNSFLTDINTELTNQLGSDKTLTVDKLCNCNGGDLIACAKSG